MDQSFLESVRDAVDKNPTVQDGINYALDVLSGQVVACKFVRQACQRFYDDMATGHHRGLRFIPEKAAEKLLFFPTFCVHIKGQLRGQPIVLEPHEAFIIINLFGWYRWDDDENQYIRRFNRAYLEMARKNNKSTISSGVGLAMVGGDGEGGAEVYSAATKKDQAKIIFDVACAMVKKSPLLKDLMKVHKNQIEMPCTDSVFKPLSRDADTLDGLNSHCNLVDELHAHPTRELWDVLITGTGSRLNPLTLTITTAGFNQDGICYEQRQIISRILDPDDDYTDDSYFGLIFTLDESDDPFDERNWPKANPSLGKAKKIRDMRTHAKEATIGLLAKINFLVKHLCVWTDVQGAWLDVEVWNKLPSDFPENINELPMWVGYDYAPQNDFTAIIRINCEFEKVQTQVETDFGLETSETDEIKRLYLRCDFFLPKAALAKLPKKLADRIKRWADKGYVTLTDGAQMRNSIPKPYLINYSKQPNFKELCFDPWNTAEMSGELDDMGLDVMHIGQTVRNFSTAMQKSEAMIHDKDIVHDHNPVMAWMMGNIEVAPDRNENIFPRKAGNKKENKIDGGTAFFTAMNRAMINGGETASAYEDGNYGI